MASSDFTNNGNVLSRKDGYKSKNIPMPTSETFHTARKAIDEENERKKGFNTLIKCRWCGDTVKELYIEKLKHGNNGKPYEITYNYEPCDSCRTKWNECVVVIEVTKHEPHPDCLPLTERIFPLAVMDSNVDSSDCIYGNNYINKNIEPERYVNEVYFEGPRSSFDPDWNVEENGCDPITQFGREVIYPTGRYVGLDPDAVRRVLTNESDICPGKIIYYWEENFEKDFGKYFN